MKTEVRALVIGGGVVGCSILYHLAKLGWRDIVLLDKNELTSGSTWHAAGGMHTFNGDANVSKLQKYTIDLYRELEALTGQSCGIHANGGLMLAAKWDVSSLFQASAVPQLFSALVILGLAVLGMRGSLPTSGDAERGALSAPERA